MIACPHCKARSSWVVDKRNGDGFVRRRRQCDDCGERFTTWESCQAPILRDRAAYERKRMAAMTPEQRSALYKRQNLRRKAREEAESRGAPVQQVYAEWGVA